MMNDDEHEPASLIWRPSVEPTHSSVPYPNSSTATSQLHYYTKTSLAHHPDPHSDQGIPITTTTTTTRATATTTTATAATRELNRRILNASQSYNSSPRPFERRASLSQVVSAGDSLAGNVQEALSLPPSERAVYHHSEQQDAGASMSPKLVHQQYNSPMNLYSMNNIRKTIEAHSELLAPGVKGINFMKADAPVNKQSEVLKLIKEQEQEAEEAAARRSQPSISTSQTLETSQQQQQRRVQYAAEQTTRNQHCGTGSYGGQRSILKPAATRAVSLDRHVGAPCDSSTSALRAGAGPPKCFECSQPIVGPFAKIQERCVHPHCFNCSTCGTSLKNSGYFTINDKLYCEIHARQVANVMRLNYNFEPNKQAVVSNQQALSEAHQRDERTQHHFHLIKQSDQEQQQVQAARPQQPLTVRHHVSPQPVAPPPPGPAVTVASSGHCAHCCALSRGHQQSAGGAATTISTMFSGTAGQHCQLCNNACSCQRRSEIRWTWRPASHSSVAEQQSTSQSSLLSSSATRALEQRNKYESRLHANYAAHESLAGTGPASSSATAPVCCHCRVQIYGPYILAGDTTWCKSCSQTNFVCQSCHRSLLNIGFIEDSQRAGLFNCEHCYETHLAPVCAKCHARIRGDCLNALGKRWHPTCFVCGHCRGPFGNSSFYLEDEVPYCERDWNLLFTAKCFCCGYPIEAGDKWIEALGRNYHSDCFRCTGCQVKLEGSTFYCKGGKPYCQMHAR